MKRAYTIFSKLWLLNIIAIAMVVYTIQIVLTTTAGLCANGISYFHNGDLAALILFLLLLVFNVWMLTSTLLPIIKISNKGIVAYSIFWKRSIQWEEIRTVKLLKVNTARSGGSLGRASVSFELTDTPETKNNVFKNKGVRVRTFIIISRTSFKKPTPFSLSFTLLTHSRIASR